MVSERQRLPERLLPIVELSLHGRDLAAHGSQANKEGGDVGGYDLFPLSALHGLIKVSQNEVNYWHRPGAKVQSGQYGMHSVL